jgi:hypothetical protein
MQSGGTGFCVRNVRRDMTAIGPQAFARKRHSLWRARRMQGESTNQIRSRRVFRELIPRPAPGLEYMTHALKKAPALASAFLQSFSNQNSPGGKLNA